MAAKRVFVTVKLLVDIDDSIDNYEDVIQDVISELDYSFSYEGVNADIVCEEIMSYEIK